MYEVKCKLKVYPCTYTEGMSHENNVLCTYTEFYFKKLIYSTIPATGDMRVNEQILLTLFHTVWARHHNNIAAKLKSSNPAWNDEKLFQEARRIVGAQLQVVTYNEYLPRIIGMYHVDRISSLLSVIYIMFIFKSACR